MLKKKNAKNPYYNGVLLLEIRQYVFCMIKSMFFDI